MQLAPPFLLKAVIGVRWFVLHSHLAMLEALQKVE